MTREEARKAAEVMLAYADGKAIETRFNCDTDEKDWHLTDIPTFDFQTKQYRVKPKFDPKTLQPFDMVLARIGAGEVYYWFADFVSTPAIGNDLAPRVIGSRYTSMVIPYNEDTKHLVGTSDEAPEFYRYWED